jgi:hypothetical protein
LYTERTGASTSMDFSIVDINPPFIPGDRGSKRTASRFISL